MTAPAQGTAEWREWRRQGLGASELPALVGADPYKSEYQLALEKRGLVPLFEGNQATAWGHRVQRLALDVYAETTGKRVQNVSRTTIDKRYPHLFAHLDGKVVGERRGIEAKWTARWDEPPKRVVIQCLAQIGLAKLDAVDVIRLGPYGEPTIHTVERDDLAIRNLLELGEAWYVRFVLGNELPAVDGSQATSHYLDALPGENEMRATPQQENLALTLLSVRNNRKYWEQQEALTVNQLKESMVGSYLLTGNGWRITWKPTKERTKTDWKSLSDGLLRQLPEDERATLVSLHSTTEEGTRPFRAVFEGDDK